ncbi:MAG TPA: hypothetical protein VFS05_14730 [Gemmatimonadaceae bacterium]|nr:hypothetical protein [Gemmatimonadaceae bacterium]
MDQRLTRAIRHAAAALAIAALAAAPTSAQEQLPDSARAATPARDSSLAAPRDSAGGTQGAPADTTAAVADSAADSTTKIRSGASAGKGGAASAKGDAKGGTRRTTAAAPARPKPEWPVKGPPPLPGSILPAKRIVAFYGNPLSRRMGILGELPPEQMLAKLDKEVAAWNAADPSTPVQPALHLIAVVAQGSAGRDGKWRARMDSALIEKVYGWAQKRNALLFLDIQVGKSTLREELPRLAPFLSRPDVHLGIDPEFSMKRGHAPGTRIGSYDAADVNYAASFLADLVTTKQLPPKVLVVHRFTRAMLTNARDIRLDPRVQIVIHMDGWGPPHLKRGSYQHFVYSEPVQFTGFKLFYKNDTKKGHPLMKPADILALEPKPGYIQYQ